MAVARKGSCVAKCPVQGPVALPQLSGTQTTEMVACAPTAQLLFAVTLMFTLLPEDDVEHDPPVTPPP
jgi:hypothetical protein